MLPTADSAFAHDYESDDLTGFSIFPLVVIIAYIILSIIVLVTQVIIPYSYV